ncbi:MAG TPA: hypothetical protein VFQ53_25250 [Kofleriaceae bacterium]|nr:hypothetical protein [Kofleriaceae bacterium]
MTEDTKPVAARAFWMFAAAWSISIALRQIHRQDFFTTPLCSAVTVMAVLCLLRPSSTSRFVLLNFLCVLHYLVHAPAVGHQELVALFVELAVLTAAVAHAIASRSIWAAASGADLLARFSAPIRVVAVIVYLWAVVQKLNTEYLWNHDQSCGALLSAAIPASYPGVYSQAIASVHPGEAASLFGIWSTLIIETAIPLLLVFRRTALHGALLGVAFHGFLGFVYWWHFSPLLYALYILFLPGDAVHAIADSLAGIVRRRPEWLQRGLELALAIGFPILALATFESLALQRWLASYQTFAWKGPGLDPSTLFGWIPFCGYAALVLYVTARATRALRRTPVPRDAYLKVRATPAVLIFGLLAFLNGLAPHLGLKTSQTFTMYSNLRIGPGTSNHLFLPASLQIASYHDDTVEVLSKSDAIPSGPWFIGVEVGWKYPYIELRRRISALARKGVTGMSITFRRNGRRIEIERAELDPELGTPLPYLAEKFFVFEQYRPERIVCP